MRKFEPKARAARYTVRKPSKEKIYCYGNGSFLRGKESYGSLKEKKAIDSLAFHVIGPRFPTRGCV